MEILTNPCALILRAFAWSSFDQCGADAISRGLSQGEFSCLSPAIAGGEVNAAISIKTVDTEQKRRLFMAGRIAFHATRPQPLKTAYTLKMANQIWSLSFVFP